jgi:hypothetical protein
MPSASGAISANRTSQIANQEPPPAAPPSTPTQPRTPEAIGAQIAAATAAPAGLLAVGAVQGAIAAAQLRAIVRGTLAELRRMSRMRLVAVVPLVHRHTVPVRPGSMTERVAYARRPVLEQHAADERRYEAAFARKQLARIQRDLPAALRQPNDRARRRRLEGLIGRETHYTRLRMDAIAARAAGIADSLNVEQFSPAGGVWELGATLNHTAGCLLLHGRALAWEALRAERYVPPVHLRCDCRVRPLDIAVFEGLLPRLVIPTVAESLALIRAAKRLEAA